MAPAFAHRNFRILCGRAWNNSSRIRQPVWSRGRRQFARRSPERDRGEYRAPMTMILSGTRDFCGNLDRLRRGDGKGAALVVGEAHEDDGDDSGDAIIGAPSSEGCGTSLGPLTPDQKRTHDWLHRPTFRQHCFVVFSLLVAAFQQYLDECHPRQLIFSVLHCRPWLL